MSSNTKPISDGESIKTIEETKDQKTTKSKENLRRTRDDLCGTIIAVGNTINWKIALLLWLVFIMMSTEIFIEKFLERFNGAVEGERVTMTGTFISSLFLVIAYILIDMLYK